MAEDMGGYWLSAVSFGLSAWYFSSENLQHKLGVKG
jgi:hypothetical protein